MELLLNAVWVLVAGALAFCALGSRQRNRHSMAHLVLACACVLVLLFPVISMTDDLYAQQFAIEDTSPATKAARSGDQSKCSPVSQTPAIVVALPSIVPDLHTATRLDDGQTTVVHCAFMVRLEGRAPPLS